MRRDEPLRGRLREALPVAMKARDRVAVGVLRAALAAIENAEAVAGAGAAKAIEESPAGAGATDVARRVAGEAEVALIVRAEIAEREAAAAEYERAGQAERAALLRREAEVLAAHLGAGT